MSEQQEQRQLVAVTSVMAPKRQVNGVWQPAVLYKPGQNMAFVGIDEKQIQKWVTGGYARWAGQDALPHVTPTKALVGTDADDKDNEAEISASGKDGDFDDRLDQIAADQKASGIDPVSEQAAQKEVDINLDTGEITETGDEESQLEDEELADSQVD